MTSAHSIFLQECFEPAEKKNTIRLLFKAFLETCSFKRSFTDRIMQKKKTQVNMPITQMCF